MHECYLVIRYGGRLLRPLLLARRHPTSRPQDYNVRNYILRRSREGFAANRGASPHDAARLLREVRAEEQGWCTEAAVLATRTQTSAP